MNNEEIRKELIRILNNSAKNDYMWYYDGYKDDGFDTQTALITLINTLSTENDKPYVYDPYEE